MSGPPLSGPMRTRVVIVAVSSALLVLLMLPLAVVSIARSDDTGRTLAALAIGLGLPMLFGALMWWQVRRWRRNPDVRRREPNKAASRILTFGTLVVLMVGNIVRGLIGGPDWHGWVGGGVVVVVGVLVVFLVAKRQDPRLHFFRRPDPLPEGEEPEPARTPAPW